MTDISKLSTLLDDPEVRALIFGLAHVRSAFPSTESGAPRLRAIVLHLADTTHLEQYRSWLSDDAPNMAMTVDQVRMAVGDGAINDLALFVGGSPNAVAWQLAAVLPDLWTQLPPAERSSTRTGSPTSSRKPARMTTFRPGPSALACIDRTCTMT
jgi:xanthosine utilization system XapX-like protein